MGCVIMASGLSRRFGGNKLLADFHGEPMIMRILHATEGLFDRRVVVTRHQEIVRLCAEHGVEVLLHDKPHFALSACYPSEVRVRLGAYRSFVVLLYHNIF